MWTVLEHYQEIMLVAFGLYVLMFRHHIADRILREHHQGWNWLHNRMNLKPITRADERVQLWMVTFGGAVFTAAGILGLLGVIDLLPANLKAD